MSVVEGPDEGSESELEWALDDRQDPETITMYPRNDAYELVTHWITIDLEHAISLEEVR